MTDTRVCLLVQNFLADLAQKADLPLADFIGTGQPASFYLTCVMSITVKTAGLQQLRVVSCLTQS